MCIVEYDNEGTVTRAYNALDTEAEAEIKKYAGYLAEIERRRVQHAIYLPDAVRHYCILLAKAIFSATHYEGDLDQAVDHLTSLLNSSTPDNYIFNVLAIARKRHRVWFSKNNPRNAYR